jgi:hypothetical protein
LGKKTFGVISRYVSFSPKQRQSRTSPIELALTVFIKFIIVAGRELDDLHGLIMADVKQQFILNLVQYHQQDKKEHHPPQGAERVPLSTPSN